MSTQENPKRASLRVLAACFFLYPVVALSETAPAKVAPDDVDDAREHYEAREALRLGKIRPLEAIIEAVRKHYGGDIIEIEFERNDGRYVYELEIIEPTGRLIEIEVDAKSAEIIASEEDD